jgi:hypothetical protein
MITDFFDNLPNNCKLFFLVVLMFMIFLILFLVKENNKQKEKLFELKKNNTIEQSILETQKKQIKNKYITQVEYFYLKTIIDGLSKLYEIPIVLEQNTLHCVGNDPINKKICLAKHQEIIDILKILRFSSLDMSLEQICIGEDCPTGFEASLEIQIEN